MIPEKIIERALGAPASAIEYQLSTELAALLAGKGVIETSSWAFDIEDFAAHDQCQIEVLPAPRPLVSRVWSGSSSDEFEMGLREVTWKDEKIQVLRVRWATSCGQESRQWVIARDQATVHAFFDAVCGFCIEPHQEVYVFEEGYWDKSEELYSAIQGATLEGLTLAPGLKEELLRDATTFFSSEASYAEYDIPWKRGLLLTGPPGNGKTHAIKGLINALGKNCLYARSFSCENVSDQRNIRAVFQRARSTAPCVLILEDLDSLITDKNRSFFLNELDGFAENHGILVIATTNHPERLDPAIVERPSRFDRKYLFDLPALAERHTYLRRWHGGLRPELRVAEDTLDRVAEQTGGFSFAYLKELVVSSTMRWAQDMKPGAMETILPATTELLRQQIHTVAGE